MWDLLVVNPFTNALLWVYDLLNSVGIPGSFGFAIILFTILTRVITYPLTAKQIQSTKAMQELQQSKQWQDIQKKFKNDREKLAQEQMKLYKELGVNPFGSCLPTLIQLPIIFGLYQSIILALASTPLQLLELSRRVYTTLDVSQIIPLDSKFLWMNLGEPERLVVFGIGIPVLAILVAVTTYVQSKLTMMPSANPNDQSAQMTKMMSIYMPLLMGYFAYTFASGIALYFIASNIVGVLQYAAMGSIDWKSLLPGGGKKRK